MLFPPRVTFFLLLPLSSVLLQLFPGPRSCPFFFPVCFPFAGLGSNKPPPPGGLGFSADSSLVCGHTNPIFHGFGPPPFPPTSGSDSKLGLIPAKLTPTGFGPRWFFSPWCFACTIPSSSQMFFYAGFRISVQLGPACLLGNTTPSPCSQESPFLISTSLSMVPP